MIKVDTVPKVLGDNALQQLGSFCTFAATALALQ
jgi:hypothetical protein